MLLSEWKGEFYNKSAARRALSPLLDNRSDSSIEMKFRNISAVLLSYGIPPIFGYKPLPNYQASLEDVTVLALTKIANFSDLATRAVSSVDIQVPTPALKPASVPEVSTPWKSAVVRRKILKNDLVAVESHSAPLHCLALNAVANYEKSQLLDLGLEGLAEAVKVQDFDERTGQGIVLSSSSSGDLKSIIVKATNSVSEFPFFVTADEVDMSSDASSGFHLYRVFGLRHEAGFYKLRGNLRASAQLTPTDYSALPRC
jgi:hypothetical protein